MAQRRFKDRFGRDWEVWEIVPAPIDRRHRSTPVEAPGQDTPPIHGEQRGDSEHRRAGWLVFQAKHGKRRLSPVPDGWASLEDSDLEILMERSTLLERPSRPMD